MNLCEGPITLGEACLIFISPDFPSSGDNEVGQLDRRAQLFLFLLCVVDGIPLQPVLITRPANVPQSTTSDARGQTAGFPSDTCSESNGPAREAECQRSADRSMAVSGITAQHTDRRSNDRRLQGTSKSFAKKWSKGSSFEECFSTATRSVHRRIQNPSAVFKLGFRPVA